MSYDPSQEVRFAVVMYGGVSLAIYMNGIAQELLRVVRATADLPGARLDGTELVYRELGQILHHGREPGTGVTAETEVRTRIVVDILSGTSAGGINAVFLAKALAHKNCNLDVLRDMWLKDADIDSLLNDGSPSWVGALENKHKTSLLNSQLMYELLLKALSRMDAAAADAQGGRLADRLDLFVTTTDLNGLAAPIMLTDSPIDERAHRMVFHFEQDPDEPLDHFTNDFNPMLAFAARCTSSFPTAFEPMKYSAIPKVLQRPEFDRFFERYQALGENFTDRPFADGGYLDNKPFSYAIEAIEYRDTDRPVTRKLLFIDPTPEHSAREPKASFNFIDNTLAAASTLPRYETIRGDVERINQHNRLQSRLSQLLERTKAYQDDRSIRLSGEQYAQTTLSELVSTYQYGACYAPYHHQKVADVTDWVSRLATRVMGLNEESDNSRAVRHLVRAWRDANFSPEGGANKHTESRFLLAYDLDYRMRRLKHLRAHIDEQLIQEAKRTSTNRERLALLKKYRGMLRVQLTALRKFRRLIESRSRSPLLKSLEQAQNRVTRAQLDQILNQPTEVQQRTVASAVYQRHSAAIDELAKLLAQLLEQAFKASSTAITEALEAERLPVSANEAERQLVAELREQHHKFELHDQLSLPFLMGTGVRESGPIEIFRISPADANLKPSYAERGEHKLAGTQLGNFGAFLSTAWRGNDIMWGRLDGAERIITALLPDDRDLDLRSRLVERAQLAILEEELDPQKNGRLAAWLVQYLHCQLGGPYNQAKMLDSVTKAAKNAPRDRTDALILRLFAQGDYLDFIRHYYRMPPDPARHLEMKWAARATRIFGEMFEALPDWGPNRFMATRLKLGGSLLMKLTEFTLPETIGRVLLRYWLLLIGLASIILILFGQLVPGQRGVATVGLVTLPLTLLTWFTISDVGNWLGGSPRLRIVRFIKGFGVPVVVALCVIGAYTVWQRVQGVK